MKKMDYETFRAIKTVMETKTPNKELGEKLTADYGTNVGKVIAVVKTNSYKFERDGKTYYENAGTVMERVNWGINELIK
jgi:hypothetical protein